MTEFIKNFKQWISEKKSVADTETDGEDVKVDDELENKQDEYMAKKANKCPRCGEPFPCDCQEKDSMDTYTAYRFKGKIKKLK